jgi:hypothetical protein
MFTSPINSCLSLIVFFVLGTDITSSAGIDWAGSWRQSRSQGTEAAQLKELWKEEEVSELDAMQYLHKLN